MAEDEELARDSRRLVLVLRFVPQRTERLFQEGDALMFNAASLLSLSEQDIRKGVRRAFDQAEGIASAAHKKLVPSIDFRAFNNDMLPLLTEPGFRDETIDELMQAISWYRKRSNAAGGSESWPAGPQYPQYDITKDPALVRYGNVELRVIENFLLAPDELRKTVEQLTGKWKSEADIYAPSNPTGFLIHDDPDWNLRRLVTNAGFYVGTDSDRAWECLSDWANRYIAGICNSHLVWSNTKSLFFPRIQRALNQKTGFVPQYVQLPIVQRIYDNIKGKEILFISPLAHIVNEQAASGRIWNLYTGYEVPRFSVRAIPARVSIWPHRPHTDWSETFDEMCKMVSAAYRERPFELVIAACGCYGLPIVDFARSTYNCSTLYLGHQAHNLFGILPSASGRINPEMWARSDLGKYENMDRIDKGRYLLTDR